MGLSGRGLVDSSTGWLGCDISWRMVVHKPGMVRLLMKQEKPQIYNTWHTIGTLPEDVVVNSYAQTLPDGVHDPCPKCVKDIKLRKESRHRARSVVNH